MSPLAVLTDEAAADLPRALDLFGAQVRQPDVPQTLARDLIGSAYTLSGLRYNSDQMTDLFRRVTMTLEDSTTYQLIHQKGVMVGHGQGVAQGVAQVVAQERADEAVRLMLRLGRKRFAVTPPDAELRLKAVNDVDRLERMADRMFDAADWDDLLSTP